MDDGSTEIEQQTPVMRTARGVAIGASAGMVLLSLWLFSIPQDHPWRVATITLLSLYSVVILSFLGGVRWAFAFQGRDGRERRDLIIGALPAVVAPCILFIAMPAAFAVLAAAFAAMGAWDSLASFSGSVPAWYGRLRMQLTGVIVLALMLAFIATS
ncbi:MAG: DUF3429 domain-containing protein [Rhizobiaceae bacterium]|nr:DUF3429 domain-containing protein [Rhizobiaceae bacterium]